VAPLGSADSLRELLDLVARNPDHKRSRLKPWLSVVGLKKQERNSEFRTLPEKRQASETPFFFEL